MCKSGVEWPIGIGPPTYVPSINLHLLITLWGATLWRSIHRTSL